MSHGFVESGFLAHDNFPMVLYSQLSNHSLIGNSYVMGCILYCNIIYTKQNEEKLVGFPGLGFFIKNVFVAINCIGLNPP